jgi:TonB family protein
VPTASKRWISFFVLSAAVTGCAGPGFVSEHPVENQVPALKPGVYKVTAVDVRPVATREVEPDYPPELGSILTGKAMVVFTVRADGKVADPSVVEADDILFGEAAVKAVFQWRFRPAKVHGTPVDCRMTLPFVFTSPYGYPLEQGSSPDVPGSPPDDTARTSVESR